mmetsp:Transcript_4701/g.5635  ORF Transcript_4701/g.5635 Transcript_4701/m.5635 type:complete len:339 (-) Transcript_4701:30-1046(-)
MNILKCTTQARVQIYLHTHPLFQDCMVYIDMESCAAMKQGIFLANEGVEDVSNYGPHFCGTQSMKQTRNNFLLLELKATHRQMTQEDLINATTQTIQYPITYHETCDFMKNYSNMIIIDFGERSKFAKSGVEIVRQLSRHVKDWNNCFKQFKDFGAYFISQIGIRHQRFLVSCSQKDPGSIDFDELDCDKFLKKCRRKEMIFSTPDWLKLQRNPPDNKRKYGQDNDDRKGNEQQRHKGQDLRGQGPPRNTTVVMCKIVNSKIRVKSGDYGRLFNRKNRKGIDNPKLDGGLLFCHKIMANGKCTEGCFNKAAHVAAINDGEENRWCAFVKKLEEAAKKG